MMANPYFERRMWHYRKLMWGFLIVGWWNVLMQVDNLILMFVTSAAVYVVVWFVIATIAWTDLGSADDEQVENENHDE